MSIVRLRVHRWCWAALVLAGTTLACADRDAPRHERSHRERDPAAAKSEAPTATKSADDPPVERVDPVAPTAGTPAATGTAAPASEFHLDDAEVEYEPARRPAAGHKSRALELVLRSTPPGAVAAVDGITVGPTPTLWEGTVDGRVREFTFVLPGYAIARYRFVPTQSGVVHGTLGRLKVQPDAGPVEAAVP
jgi:hypothetical protein